MTVRVSIFKEIVCWPYPKCFSLSRLKTNVEPAPLSLLNIQILPPWASKFPLIQKSD